MNTKICSRCKQEKSTSEFSKNSAKKDGLNSHCKSCHREWYKEWYKGNKNSQYERVKKRQEKQVQRNRDWLWNYLLHHPCVDCGESDPIVLEFDHQEDKKMNISNMVNSGYSIETLSLEVSKCEVRCANCHRRKTAKQFNTWKITIAAEV